MRKLIFKQMQSPGDLLMLTVAIRDLHFYYPNEFETDTITCYPEVFYNNPFITNLPKDNGIEIIDLDYGSYLHKLRRRGYHFSDCFIYMLNEKLNLNIKKTSSRPLVVLTDMEKSKRYFLEKFKCIKKPFWLLNAGIKNDIPLKQYPPYRYQQVVTSLNENSHWHCQIVQVGHDHHIHPAINGTINLVGSTNNLRDYFSLVYHSEGCIGPVSLQMHISAAFNKPCVILAGGREEPSWEKYKGHSYIDTINELDCCKYEGCWKKAIADCIYIDEDHRYPRCMELIDTDIVVNEIVKYQQHR